jgi:alpha-L-rhamnosidase
MDLMPDDFRERIVKDLTFRLRKDRYHLRTGFVGTPYLCRVLSKHNANDIAYRLLLNEDYPSWLYAINLGATTIWERWNSLNQDGTISSTGMNSLNHYAYGSIVEWMYRDMCGLNPSSGDIKVTGFRHALLAPKPHHSIQWAKASCNSAAGYFESGWQIGEGGELTFEFTIPFNASAKAILPDAIVGEITINGSPATEGTQSDHTVELDLGAGKYIIVYKPTREYRQTYNSYTPIGQLVKNKQVVERLAPMFPQINTLDEFALASFGNVSLREMGFSPFLRLTVEQMNQIDEMLKDIVG